MSMPWIGTIPVHWKTQRAKYMFAKQSRPIRDEDDVVTCFRDGVVTLRKNRRTTGFTESTQWSGYQGVRKGDSDIEAESCGYPVMGSGGEFARASKYIYGNPQWEKLSIFMNLLLPKLPSPVDEDLSAGILDVIDLDSYRAEAGNQISIVLKDEDAEVEPVQKINDNPTLKKTLGDKIFNLTYNTEGKPFEADVNL